MNFLTGMMEWDFDITIVEFFNSLIQGDSEISKFFAFLFNALSQLGAETIFIVIIAVVYLGFDKKLAKEVGQSAFFAMVFNNSLKGVFNRFRPFQQSPDTIKCGDTGILSKGTETSEGVVKVTDPFSGKDVYSYTTTNSNGVEVLKSSSSSFPSGHSNGASSVYNSFALYIKKNWAWVVSTILCIVVMISRMVLGAHFLTDVIGGYLTGLLFILFMYFLKKVVKNEDIIYIVLIAIFGIATVLSPLYSDNPGDLFSTYGVAVGMVLGLKFEEKKVDFKQTKCWWKIILRVLFGLGIAFLLKEGLKLPYNEIHEKNFSEMTDIEKHINWYCDMLRYAIMVFFVSGIYPLIIKKVKFLND